MYDGGLWRCHEGARTWEGHLYANHEIILPFLTECDCNPTGVNKTMCDEETGDCFCKSGWHGDSCEGKIF